MRENENALLLDRFLGFEIYKEDRDHFYLFLTNTAFEESKGYQVLSKLNARNIEYGS